MTIPSTDRTRFYSLTVTSEISLSTRLTSYGYWTRLLSYPSSIMAFFQRYDNAKLGTKVKHHTKHVQCVRRHSDLTCMHILSSLKRSQRNKQLHCKLFQMVTTKSAHLIIRASLYSVICPFIYLVRYPVRARAVILIYHTP